MKLKCICPAAPPPSHLSHPNLTLQLLGWRTSDCVTSTWSPTAGTTIRATCALTGRSFTLLVWHLCRPAEPSGCVPHTCERKQPGLGSDSHKTAYLPTHTDAQARRLRTHKHNDKNNTNGAVSTSKYLTIKEKWGHRINFTLRVSIHHHRWILKAAARKDVDPRQTLCCYCVCVCVCVCIFFFFFVPGTAPPYMQMSVPQVGGMKLRPRKSGEGRCLMAELSTYPRWMMWSLVRF